VQVEAVKFVKGSSDTIEGLALPFGGPFAGKDIHRQSFGPDTDFALDWFPQGRPIVYEHGLDGSLKTSVQGRQTEHELSPEEGIWARGQLDTSAKYHKAVSRLIKEGALFFSSASMPHLVRGTKSGHITRWPWIELTLTPTPANPSQPEVSFLKSVDPVDLMEHLDASGLEVPPGLVAEALKSLAEADPEEDDEGLRAGLKFADNADRLLADVEAFRTRTGSLVELRAKSGRVLSGATRERLARHPDSLRELADDLDQLLTEADADKAAKSVLDAIIEAERERSRALGVSIS